MEQHTPHRVNKGDANILFILSAIFCNIMRPFSSEASASSTYGKKRLPFWVIFTFRPCLANSATPNSFSSSDIAWLSEGWVMHRLEAASV